MFKFKNTLIAAAALASVVAPSLAFAGDIGREIKDQRSQLHSTRDQFHDLKTAYKNGDITREYYLQQRSALLSQLGDIQSNLDDLRDERSSR